MAGAVAVGGGVDLDGVAGDADDPLDEVLGDVARRLQHHDVAALGRVQVIGELVGEEEVAVGERRHHADAVDADGLERERDDDVEADREGGDLHEVAPRACEPEPAAGGRAHRHLHGGEMIERFTGFSWRSAPAGTRR